MKLFFSLLIALMSTSWNLSATPSSEFWTICTTSVYDTGLGHLDNDYFFTIFDAHGERPILSPDVGFELGIFSWKDWKSEAGVDFLGGTDAPLFFNFSIAIEEDKLFPHAPSFKVGIFDIGTSRSVYPRTDRNTVDIIFGKTLPKPVEGSLYIGVFSGSRAIGRIRQGIMFAYEKFFSPAKDENDKEYFKWRFCADYASGNNVYGGGGFGLSYSYNPDISVLMGPTWFISNKFNGEWKWSVQISYDFPVFKPPKAK